MRVMLLVPVLLVSAVRSFPADQGTEYTERVRPVLEKYCLACHSTAKKKGDLDLERFATLEAIRRDLRPWPLVIENLENGEMPPKKHPQPGADERGRVSQWVRGMLEAEARAHSGDPGRVVVRRLSNAEYNNTVRDLTGIDLEPARDFPADGAAGEGFTNAGDALVMSSTLLAKYLAASKEIADHLVLLPDGFRFSPSKTRRDWTDEAIAQLRAFYAPYPKDGKLPVRPYLSAAVRRREDLLSGRTNPAAVAREEKLNPKYFGILWNALSGAEASFPLDRIRAKWRSAAASEPDALQAEIAAWQESLWRFNKIGSYGGGKLTREEAADPSFAPSQVLKIQPKPVPGKSDVTIYFSSLSAVGEGDVVFARPRFLSGNQTPLFLKDYAQFGEAYEVDLRATFSDTAAYLGAAARTGPSDGLDPALLARWKEILGLEQAGKIPAELDPARMVPAGALEPLDVPTAVNSKWPAIRGWQTRRGELPVLLANASDKAEHIPGLASAHAVVVHPSPDRFVAAAWTSPIEGRLRVEAKVRHVHPGCGNGILWWVEVRREHRSLFLAQGVVDPGQPAQIPPRELRLAAGDEILVAVDPRDGNHVCDLTEIGLTLRETEGERRSWDLARDCADAILTPHAPWRFVAGSTQRVSTGTAPGVKIPPDSLLGKWRSAPDPALALKVQALLSGERPAQEKSPDRVLYDGLVGVDSPLLRGLPGPRRRNPAERYGLEVSRFSDQGDLVLPAGATLSVRLPSALFRDHELVVDASLPAGGSDRAVQFQVSAAPPAAIRVLDGKSPCVSRGAASERLLQGLAEFRSSFPTFICFPKIVPDDEAVCLKLYHREDEPLRRLFLDEEQARRLDRLWEEHRYITQWPETENKNLPLFIGFVTQDGGAEAVRYFEGLRAPFQKRAEAFEKEVQACEPRQEELLLEFAERAYRRPLTEAEKGRLKALYADLRQKPMTHLEAMRTVLVRILVAPSFLFRVEVSEPGSEARAVSGSELATRLSYFLWASTPDRELGRLGAEGTLLEPAVQAAQIDRMLKDPKVRGLATEFATQWLHVRNFRQNREKNEKLFPMFDAPLRDALFEEAVLFFVELLHPGHPSSDLVDADFTFLNERLAHHYAIPGVKGTEMRRVDGVKKYGRGGILALGSILAQESGASRTSPVLRGNWVVDTLLGEKLPKPPANVPRLPEEEPAAEGTVREMVARHTSVPECVVCHVRIDPFGFALEKYDAIGRLREKELGGRQIDASVQLKDGTRFEGIEGLRTWLLKSRRRDFERTFCQKLLGYALGRSVTLTDQPLLEEMVSSLEQGGTLSEAVSRVARSRQFRHHRGLESTKEE